MGDQPTRIPAKECGVDFIIVVPSSGIFRYRPSNRGMVLRWNGSELGVLRFGSSSFCLVFVPNWIEDCVYVVNGVTLTPHLQSDDYEIEITDGTELRIETDTNGGITLTITRNPRS